MFVSRFHRMYAFRLDQERGYVVNSTPLRFCVAMIDGVLLFGDEMCVYVRDIHRESSSGV